ncbi:hypothetical protein F5148DRAFT_273117 [Russula earlei]|uniref:Uncharacterized protein n=1 Tax=Russula earlei TaxID=71964 RepID=A0ACC0U4H2_9AGAM|nr:hypothetical protein F5148DRAFT_273117 [Russula earlei]
MLRERLSNPCGRCPTAATYLLMTLADLPSKTRARSSCPCGAPSTSSNTPPRRLPRPRIVQTLPAHPDSDPVHALSLSHDGTLLTVASAGAVVVHNLALGTQTALRGLPGPVAVCTFHVHSRVRLLLGIGHELVIYDITRPSAPSRVASIGGGKMGDVVAVACSPYSKTLLAVACSEGYVALVDLDKELSLIRSFSYKFSVTSLLFSLDGASLYIGTENGKLLLQTLRSMEAPRIIAVGEQGCRVEGLAIANKSKLSIDANSRTTGSINSKPVHQPEISSPLRLSTSKVPHAPSIKKSISDSPAETGNPPPKNESPPLRKRVNSATTLGNRRIVSSVRSIFANDSLNVPRGKPSAGNKGHAAETSTSPPLSPSSLTTSINKPSSRVSLRPKPSNSTTLSVPGSLARERTLSGSSTRRTEISEAKASSVATSHASPRTRTTSAPKNPAKLSPTMIPRHRTKVSTSPAQSSASRVPNPLDAASPSSRRTPPATRRMGTRSSGSARDPSRQATTSSVGRTRTTRVRTLVPPVACIPPPTLSTSTRMPSPESSMPSPLRDTMPPFPIREDKTQRKGLSMLGLATPEVERWIAGDGESKDRGKARGKNKDLDVNGAVEFPADSSEEDDGEGPNKPELNRRGRENIEGAPCLRPVSMQITPRKAAWAMSPLRHSIAEGSPGVGGLTGLLHAHISDAMLDFRQETRAEMVGLHLDLVRMGRAWRREMRDAMQEYVGDLKELREENRKLRDENERLRRGY